MWAGVVLYATVAWRVAVRRREAPDSGGDAPRSGPAPGGGQLSALSGPHAMRHLVATAGGSPIEDRTPGS